MSQNAATRPQPDRLLLFTTVALCAAGLVMVTSASVAFAYNQHESTFYYAERQAGWLAIGFVALLVLGRIDYRRLRPLAPAGAVAAGLLMLLVLVPHVGVTVNGARRWFDAGPLGTFQPSELGKLAFAVFVGHWVDRNAQRMGNFNQVFIPFAAMLVVALVLLLLEPDLGTAIVTVAIFISAYWAGGGRLRHIILIAGALGLGFVAVTVLEPYRMSRLVAFKNPWADPLGAGFQATQSLYGLASGGWFGVGIGHSIEKYGWLPEAPLASAATAPRCAPRTASGWRLRPRSRRGSHSRRCSTWRPSPTRSRSLACRCRFSATAAPRSRPRSRPWAFC